jgi:pimeloyl-ACP methyl ester carboxylesterase
MRSARVALVVALALVAACPAVAATADLPLKRGDFAGSFGIGHGRAMYLECYGDGSPTVILDSGLRNGARVWNDPAQTRPGPRVFPAVARFTRVCGYDRPGTINNFSPFEFSRSSAAPMPRTAADAASDLHALLKVATVPGPYVFVNHSTGGLIDRLYAANHPRQVAGMVLVDALAEYLESGFSRAQMDVYEHVNNDPIEGIDYPDLEQILFRRSFEQMRRAAGKQPFPDVPLSVMSHGLPFTLPEGLPAGFTSSVIERAWTNAQDRLAKLTPDTRHVVAKRSSHYIMFTQPRLVIDQVRRVVREVRRERSRGRHD